MSRKNLDVYLKGRVAVIQIRGEVVNGPDVAAFQSLMSRQISLGIVHMVCDLSKVSWFGSPMLGVLAAGFSALKKAGGDIRLAGVTDKIKETLAVAGLTDIFQMLETVDEAVASFEEGLDPAGDSSLSVAFHQRI